MTILKYSLLMKIPVISFIDKNAENKTEYQCIGDLFGNEPSVQNFF